MLLKSTYFKKLLSYILTKSALFSRKRSRWKSHHVHVNLFFLLAILSYFPLVTLGYPEASSKLFEKHYSNNTDEDLHVNYGDRKYLRLPRSAENQPHTCVKAGHISISRNWYGYLAIGSFRGNKGTLYYKFRYPQKNCCIRILFYLHEQFEMLKAYMNCAQKEALLDPRGSQVITLSPGSNWPSCNVTTAEETMYIECSGGLILKTAHKADWYIAASSCGSPTGLNLEYELVLKEFVGTCKNDTNLGTRCNSIYAYIFIGSLVYMNMNG